MFWWVIWWHDGQSKRPLRQDKHGHYFLISHLLFVLQYFYHNFESCCWTIYTNRKIILHDVFVQLQSIFNSTNINHGQFYPIFGFWLRNTNMWTIPKYSFSFTYFVSRYMPFLVVVCVHSVTVVRGFIGQNFSSSPLKKSFHHLVLLWKSGRYNNSNLIQIDYNFVWNATERFILSFIVMTDDFR